MKRLQIIIALVIVSVVAVGLWQYYKPHRSVKGDQPAFTLAASMLLQEFHDDERAAEARYTGKVLQVRGRVKEVIRDSDLFIVVLGEPGEMAGVSCSLRQTNSHISLEEGEQVTIKGICNGKLIDVVLDKAIVVSEPVGNQ